MKLVKGMIIVLTTLLFFEAAAFSAYHHEGEADANVFLEKYPAAAGTKLDHCALCHTGGETGGDRSKTYGSCQWCHYKTDYGAEPGDANENIMATINPFGLAYYNNGSDADALEAIEKLDSDGDEESNLTEINALTFPGDADDDSTKTPAPFRVYTKAQLSEARAEITALEAAVPFSSGRDENRASKELGKIMRHSTGEHSSIGVVEAVKAQSVLVYAYGEANALQVQLDESRANEKALDIQLQNTQLP